MDVLSFICWSGDPSGLSGRLLLDFQPGVDVLCKESYFASFRQEVVDFVDLDEGVAQFDSLLDHGGTPFSSEHALLGSVVRETRFLRQGFSHLLFHTSLAEGECEFALVSEGQNGMVQLVRGKNVHLGHSEVVVNILIVGVGKDIRVSDGVFTFFCSPMGTSMSLRCTQSLHLG